MRTTERTAGAALELPPVLLLDDELPPVDDDDDDVDAEEVDDATTPLDEPAPEVVPLADSELLAVPLVADVAAPDDAMPDDAMPEDPRPEEPLAPEESALVEETVPDVPPLADTPEEVPPVLVEEDVAALLLLPDATPELLLLVVWLGPASSSGSGCGLQLHALLAKAAARPTAVIHRRVRFMSSPRRAMLVP